MAVRIRYVRTELSEGIVEVIHEADQFEIAEDNTVILKQYTEGKKWRKVGFIHPDRWESILLVDNQPSA